MLQLQTNPKSQKFDATKICFPLMQILQKIWVTPRALLPVCWLNIFRLLQFYSPFMSVWFRVCYSGEDRL